MSLGNMYTISMGFMSFIYVVERYLKQSYPNKKKLLTFAEFLVFLTILYFFTDNIYVIILKLLFDV